MACNICNETHFLHLHCETCNVLIKKNYFNKHILTKKHKKNFLLTNKKFINKCGKKDIIENSIEFPTQILDIIFDYKKDLDNMVLDEFLLMLKHYSSLRKKKDIIIKLDEQYSKEYLMTFFKENISQINKDIRNGKSYDGGHINNIMRFNNNDTAEGRGFAFAPMNYESIFGSFIPDGKYNNRLKQILLSDFQEATSINKINITYTTNLIIIQL